MIKIINFKRIAIVLICILLILLIAVYCVPQIRIKLFVNLYHNLIEDAIAAGNGVPADDAVLLGYRAVNTWDGRHPMIEFDIMALGSTYYGCYFSPDDVPLAFQNVRVKLVLDGQNKWSWKDDTNNHGYTSKIMDRWYFYSASF